jgi:uncharacterized Fe-S radical SAM superfamily protein PflX
LAYEIYRSCPVFPHTCEVNRIEGRTGFCGQLDNLHFLSSVQHFGEELPLVGSNGIGNLKLGNTLFCGTGLIDFSAPSLMNKYQLVHKTSLNRRITPDEYEAAIAWAKELEFESLFLQYLKFNVYNLSDINSPLNLSPLDRTLNLSNV